MGRGKIVPIARDLHQGSRILVLGAGGMLGNDLMKMLGSGHEILGRDCEDFDITDENRTRDEILKIDPGIVINTAAFTDVDGCEAEVDRAYAVNAHGAGNVALACKEGNMKLLHISTDYVFDGKEESPYQEDGIPAPLNIYGKSKLKGEQYIKEIMENYCIVRTAWLYGRGGKNFANTILKLAEVKEELMVVNDQVGPPTHTKDLANAIGVLLAHNPKGIYHITNKGTCSWYQFAVEILKLAHMENVKVRPVSSEVYTRPAGRPAFSALDCSKFEEKTGLVLQPWKDALAEYFMEDSL